MPKIQQPPVVEAPPPAEPEVQVRYRELPWWEQGLYVWPDEPFVLAVDPGDLSCGVALLRKDEEDENGHQVFWVGEQAPDDFTDFLAWLIIQGKLHTVIYERFRLYGDKSVEQTGSEFMTSQLIGVIRWMVRKQNEHALLHVRWIRTNERLSCEEDSGCGPGRIPQPITLVGQMADIKKPIRKILRFKNIKSRGATHRQLIHEGRKLCAKEHCHAIDAELHGWYWLLRGHTRDITERPKIDSRHIQAMQ